MVSDFGDSSLSLLIALLPLGTVICGRNLNCRHLVLRTVGGPIRDFSGNDIGTRAGMMKGGIHDSWNNVIGYDRTEGNFTFATFDGDPVIRPNASQFCI